MIFKVRCQEDVTIQDCSAVSLIRFLYCQLDGRQVHDNLKGRKIYAVDARQPIKGWKSIKIREVSFEKLNSALFIRSEITKDAWKNFQEEVISIMTAQLCLLLKCDWDVVVLELSLDKYDNVISCKCDV